MINKQTQNNMKNTEIKKGEFFRVKINFNYYHLTLDDKTDICRTYGGQWSGAHYENGITTVILKKY